MLVYQRVTIPIFVLILWHVDDKKSFVPMAQPGAGLGGRPWKGTLWSMATPRHELLLRYLFIYHVMSTPD